MPRFIYDIEKKSIGRRDFSIYFHGFVCYINCCNEMLTFLYKSWKDIKNGS